MEKERAGQQRSLLGRDAQPELCDNQHIKEHLLSGRGDSEGTALDRSGQFLPGREEREVQRDKPPLDVHDELGVHCPVQPRPVHDIPDEDKDSPARHAGYPQEELFQVDALLELLPFHHFCPDNLEEQDEPQIIRDIRGGVLRNNRYHHAEGRRVRAGSAEELLGGRGRRPGLRSLNC